MLGTAASGLAMLEGADGIPSVPPTALINDYVTGYLGAAGATAALIRRAKEGGSYHVTVSLTRNAMWYLTLGLVPEEERTFAVKRVPLPPRRDPEPQRRPERAVFVFREPQATPPRTRGARS